MKVAMLLSCCMNGASGQLVWVTLRLRDLGATHLSQKLRNLRRVTQKGRHTRIMCAFVFWWTGSAYLPRSFPCCPGNPFPALTPKASAALPVPPLQFRRGRPLCRQQGKLFPDDGRALPLATLGSGYHLPASSHWVILTAPASSIVLHFKCIPLRRKT